MAVEEKMEISHAAVDWGKNDSVDVGDYENSDENENADDVNVNLSAVKSTVYFLKSLDLNYHEAKSLIQWFAISFLTFLSPKCCCFPKHQL